MHIFKEQVETGTENNKIRYSLQIARWEIGPQDIMKIRLQLAIDSIVEVDRGLLVNKTVSYNVS